MRYQLLIFDFDGTLADSFRSVMGCINVLADRHGLNHLAEEHWEELRKSHARNVLAFLGVPMWKIPRLAIEMKQLMAAVAHNVQLFPGMQETLERVVKAGYRLAIATSNSRGNVMKVLGPDAVRLFESFECDIPIFGKARRLKRLLKKAAVVPEAAIYVGDEIRDLEAAQNVGTASGAVSWGYTAVETLQAHGPDYVFLRVQDLARKLG